MPEYVDYSEYYDLDHDVTLDLDFYREFAERAGSPILELACLIFSIKKLASIS